MIESAVKKVVDDAGSDRKILSMIYRKKADNKITRRQIEPYELKDGYLWGYDISRSQPKRNQTMKKWIVKNIVNLQVEQKTFMPRKFPESR